MEYMNNETLEIEAITRQNLADAVESFLEINDLQDLHELIDDVING